MREEDTPGYTAVARIVAIGLVLIGVIVSASAGIDIWLSGGELSPTTAGVLSTIAAGSLTVLSAYFTARAGGKAVAAAMEATMRSKEESMKIRETYPDGRVVEIDTTDGQTPVEWDDPYEEEAALVEQTDEDFGEEEWRE